MARVGHLAGTSLIAVGASLMLAVGALAAAARLAPGALYTGKVSGCERTGIPGTSCVFRFRSSTNGRTLRFVGKPVVDAWGCRGGGGEALLGGKLKGESPTPIPVVTVRSNGTLYGSTTYILRPSQAPPEKHRSTVTGHLTKAGKSASITFHNIYISGHGNLPCKTQPVTIATR